MDVILSHDANPDIPGGYWSFPGDDGRPKAVAVTSLEEASRVCRTYIEDNELGGGNWTGGDVVDEGNKIASISYNGRIWLPDGTEYVPQAKARQRG